MPASRWILPLTIALATAAGALAQTGQPSAPSGAALEQVEPHVGQMAVPMGNDVELGEIEDRLRFEPWQLVDEMFLRDDVVFLMRHGPTDWSVRDPKTVDPADCSATRVLSEQGARDMVNMGALMAHNGVLPGRIVVSEWCRNQQTLDRLMEGISAIDPAAAERIEVETSADLNLLLHLDGAEDGGAMREMISTWDGGEGTGPLMLLTHYTNIEEITQFRIFEGEILVLDPDRDNRVLGYLRLRSAGPDVGHFPEAAGAGSE